MWRVGVIAKAVLAEPKVIATDLDSVREPPPGPTASMYVDEENSDSTSRCEAILAQEVTSVNGDATNPTPDQLAFHFITCRGKLTDSYTIDANGRASSASPPPPPAQVKPPRLHPFLRPSQSRVE